MKYQKRELLNGLPVRPYRVDQDFSFYLLDLNSSEILKVSRQRILTEIVEFEESHFQLPWTLDEWESILSRKESAHDIHVVYSKNLEVVGLGLLGLQDKDALHLFKILIHPSYRRQGLAKEILAHAICNLSSGTWNSLYLEVAVSNKTARAFYKDMGFKELVIKKGFYTSGESAVAMHLEFAAL